MAAAASHIFGLRQNVANAPLFQDEHTLLLPAAGQIIKYRLDGLPQKFVQPNQANRDQVHDSMLVTALALSANRRYLAVSETNLTQQNAQPHIIIYDLANDSAKTKKMLTMPPEFSFRDIVSLDFSPDGKFLIAQGAAPDWTLCMWLWEKSKLLSTIKSTNPAGNPVTQISFNPNDNTQICVTGQHVFKYLRYTEGHLKQHGTQKVDPKNYTSHAWLSNDKMALTCDNGCVYILENGDVKDTIRVNEYSGAGRDRAQSIWQNNNFSDNDSEDYDEDNPNGMSHEVAAIKVTAVNTGFVVSNNKGLTFIYEPEDTKTGDNLYRLIKKIKIADNSTAATLDYVTAMTVSPTAEFLVGLTANRGLYQFSLATAHLDSNQECNWEQLGAGSHSGPIMDMSICSRKPLVATCGSEGTLKIWNYETHQCEITKRFAEDMFSVSMHPSGLHVLVGFSDKLRLMNLLIDDIKTFKEFSIRGVRLSAFSNGGHLFAVVYGHVIQIFSFSTFENITNLAGHSQKVRSLCWSPNDTSLVSCGSDGAIYQWDPVAKESNSQRKFEVVNRGVDYTSIAIDKEDKIWAAATDGQIREIKHGEILRQVKIDEPLGCIALSGRLVFGTTGNGALRCIAQPLTDPCEFTEFVGHCDSIHRMIGTQDGHNIVTASNDGSIIIWSTFESNQKNVERKHDGLSNWAEEVLVSRGDLEEKNREIVELKTRVDELKMENEYQLRLKDMSQEDKMKDLTEKFVQEMEALKLKNQLLKTEKEKEAADFEDKINRGNEIHDREIVDLEQSNNQKLMFEYERYQELQAKYQKTQTDYEAKLQAERDDKMEAIEKWSISFDQKKQQLTNELKQQDEEKRQALREFEEHKKQIEEDADREIIEMRTKYEKRLRESLESNMQLKGENGILQKKFASLNKEIETHQQDKRRLASDKDKLNDVIKSLEKDIQSLRKEIQERDETIQDKEKRIYDLKKKNQELEKFKFVLDYKIKELKKQIEPRENEIKEKKEQIQNMEGELERFHKTNISLQLEKTTLKQKLKAFDAELQMQRQKVRDSRSTIKTFKIELHKCAGKIQDPQELKKAVVKLHNATRNDGTSGSNSGDKDSDKIDTTSEEDKAHELMARQREHLERSLASLREKMNKDSGAQRADHIKIMQENVHLIAEINELRKELKLGRVRISDLETALGIRKSKKNKNKGAQEIIRDDTMKLVEQQDRIDEMEGVINRQATQIESMRCE